MNNAEIIKQSLTMEQVASYYGFKPENGKISCPFHSEKHPSCKLNKEYFYCFGCGEKGSVIDFVMKLCGIGFIDACKELDSAFSLGLTFDKPLSPQAKREHSEQLRKRKAFEEWCSETGRLLNSLYQQYCNVKHATKPPDRAYFEALSRIDYFEEMLREFESDRIKFYKDYKSEVIKWKNYLT